MTVHEIWTNPIRGNEPRKIVVKPDNQSRDQIFISAPPSCLMTREQTYQLATALADLLEETR